MSSSIARSPRHFSPRHGSAVGQRIRFEDSDEPWDIVGVVTDVAEFGPERGRRADGLCMA